MGQLVYDDDNDNDNGNGNNNGNNNGNTANNNDLLDAILKNDNVVVVGDNDKQKNNKVIFKIDRNGILNKDKEDIPKLGMVRPDDDSDNQSSHTNNRNSTSNNSNNNNNNHNSN